MNRKLAETIAIWAPRKTEALIIKEQKHVLTGEPLALCFLCALRDLVAEETLPPNIDEYVRVNGFRETAEAHAARCHPDLKDAMKEQRELLVKIMNKRLGVDEESLPDPR